MPTDYLVTDTELTSIADAIRTKGGTSAQLSFPAEFVAAIAAIPTGGGGLSASDAVLIVRAPTSATVSATKGATTVNGIEYVQDGRATVSDYLLPIPQATFDSSAWMITATKGADSWSGTITIDTAKAYFVDAVIHVPLSVYQEVEYLQTTGSQYIAITSDVLASGYSATIKYKATTFVTANPVLQHGTTNNAARRGNIGTSASGYAGWYNNSEQAALIPKTDDGIVTGTVSNIGTGVKVDLATESNTATYTWSFTPNLTGGSFICRNGYSTNQYGKYYVYYYGFDNGSTPVRRMYPCYRLSDNVAGMYDKLTDTFFTNSGSGTFTVGPDC